MCTTTMAFLRLSSCRYSYYGSLAVRNRTVVLTSCIRYYTPMTKEEEHNEKARVSGLSPFQKDQELRHLNREIARLEMLKAINDGTLYTWSGRYKALARDYGFPLVMWYWAMWCSTFAMSYGAVSVGGIDAMALIAQIDARTGWDLVSQVNPEWGKLGIALILNEVIEPVRLPIVIVTVKPVMDTFFPPKY